MLSELRPPNPAHLSTLENREVKGGSSLPDTRDTEEKKDTPGEQQEGEGEGGREEGKEAEAEGDGEREEGREGEGEGEGEREEGRETKTEGEGEGEREEGREIKTEGEGKGKSDGVAAKIDSNISEARTSVTREGVSQRRRVGVVDKPKVMVVGGNVPSPVVNRQLSRPRSATTHAMETREGVTKIGRSNTGIDVSLREPTSPTQRHSGSGQRKRAPVKELTIKPVQAKPSAAAQRMLQSKREKDGAEVDGGQAGGGEREEERVEGGEMENGSANEKNKKSGVEVNGVHCDVYIRVCMCSRTKQSNVSAF